MVWPWSTLMSVAKPWMLGSPAPVTSHSEAGFPGRQFSATISLAGGSQGPAAPAGSATAKTADTIVTTTSRTRARHHGRAADGATLNIGPPLS